MYRMTANIRGFLSHECGLSYVGIHQPVEKTFEQILKKCEGLAKEPHQRWAVDAMTQVVRAHDEMVTTLLQMEEERGLMVSSWQWSRVAIRVKVSHGHIKICFFPHVITTPPRLMSTLHDRRKVKALNKTFKKNNTKKILLKIPNIYNIHCYDVTSMVNMMLHASTLYIHDAMYQSWISMNYLTTQVDLNALKPKERRKELDEYYIRTN